MNEPLRSLCMENECGLSGQVGRVGVEELSRWRRGGGVVNGEVSSLHIDRGFW